MDHFDFHSRFFHNIEVNEVYPTISTSKLLKKKKNLILIRSAEEINFKG